MKRSRGVVVLLTVLGLTALSVLPGALPRGAAAEATRPLNSPVPAPGPAIIPDLPSCPNRISPPPPVDLSEVPVPGSPSPTPMPSPEPAVGGPRMGECGLVLPDGAPPLPEGISAASWLLADVGTGDVLAAKDPHGRHRPASTIKLLTALLATDRLPADQLVIGTRADAEREGSSAGVGPGGSYTVGQLLAGLLLVSGNDAAHALSRQLGGVPAAVEQMNELAARLGARDTRAATPSGLDGPGMSTSAYDLALVFGHVLSRPQLAALLTTRQVNFPGYGGRPGFVLSNDNRLLAHYDGAVGGKTGFTDDARHTYVGGAVRDGRALVVVLLRGEQRPVPMWQQAARLLDYGFALPPGGPVGRLVTSPQPTEGQPTETRSTGTAPPGTTAATPARPGSAAQAGSGESLGLVTGLLWLGTAALALTVLAALLARQRRINS